MRLHVKHLGWAALLASLACNSVDAVPVDDDAGADAASDATTGDAGSADGSADAPPDVGRDSGDAGRPDGCPSGVVVAEAGDTCAGFGAASPCDTACGLPPYGYVCTGGAPPNLSGCLRVSASAFGDTFCCPDLACVRVPSKDTECSGGTPRLFQCPTTGDGGLMAAPAAGCQEVTGLPVYRYFCCPP